MKKINLLLIALIVLSSCSKFKSEDLKEFNLKGSVKSVKSVKYKALEKFGSVEKGRKVSRDEDDELDMECANISILFDNENNFESWTYFDRNGDVQLKATLNDSVINSYDSYGDLMMRIIGNEIDMPTELCYYNSNGKLESKIFIKYNSGEVIEEKEYSSKGELIKLSTYKYNDLKLIEEEVRIRIEGNDSYYSNVKDTIKTLFMYQYNDNKDVIEFIQKTDGKEIKKKYTYRYDNHQNWIQRIEFTGLTPRFLIEREIKYKE